MRIVFHPIFKKVYSHDPAAKPGRIEAILKEIEDDYDFVMPQPARERDLRIIHTRRHIDSVKENPLLFEVACFSAGGAIMAAEFAFEGEPSFGLIRPPGHHASPDSCWGFCFFNNIAVAIEKLIGEGKVLTALIVDFDLHYGDGTENIFGNTSDITYFYLPGGERVEQLESLNEFLEMDKDYDILGVSAGFDRGKYDWGGIFEIEDYRTIGRMLKEASLKTCEGRRFAVLEGGYNLNVLGMNVKSFLEGFS